MTDQQNLAPVSDLQTVLLKIHKENRNKVNGETRVTYKSKNLITLPYLHKILFETYISVSFLKGVVRRVVPSDVVDPVRLVVIPLKFLLYY